jgi:hypothetical protein
MQPGRMRLASFISVEYICLRLSVDHRIPPGTDFSYNAGPTYDQNAKSKVIYIFLGTRITGSDHAILVKSR